MTRRDFSSAITLLVLTATLTGCSPGPAFDLINARSFRIQAGDDPSWAAPDFDDGGWQRTTLAEVPEPEGILWLRTEIEVLPRHRAENRPQGLHFSGMASYEIFWDGELVARGGVPAVRAEDEVPGPIQAHYVVPDRLAGPGRHEIAIRTSAHHRHFSPVVGYWALLVGDYDTIVLAGSFYTLASLVSLSGMMMVALFALTLFLVDRRDRSNLLLSALCLVAAALLVAESWRSLVGYSYDWHLVRLIVVTTLTALLHLTLLLFLIVRFPRRGGRILLGLALLGFAIALFAPGWDGKAQFMHHTGLLLGLAWTLRSWKEHRNATALTSGGLLTALAAFWWQPALFADLSLFFALDFLLVCLLVSHALRTRRIRREREAALVRSARLEIELLKKHIQPHYLMNTLTALAEWIEEEPAVASSMIQSLSEEFRLLSEISDRPLIRMDDELRLCRSHLAIMSRRKAREYLLRTEGVDPDATVPPALFHTLVENGVTHAGSSDPRVELTLRSETRNGRRRYVFEAPLGDDAGPPEEVREGTGLRYVRARLEEAYGDRWSLASGPAGSSWRTEITIGE